MPMFEEDMHAIYDRSRQVYRDRHRIHRIREARYMAEILPRESVMPVQ